MTYMNMGRTALDYFPCRYGVSKLLFRGPRRRLDGDYVVFLGGTETYGKFVETPFPSAFEHATGIRSVNLGCVNAGIDAYLQDACLIRICAKAKVTVIQLMGAQNMSNRFYTVHPRRNDRFLRPSQALKDLFPEIDFAEFSFTRHMLVTLADISEARFAAVQAELKAAWVARMQRLIERIDGEVVLLWLADHAPRYNDDSLADKDPLFIDRAMIQSLSGLVSHVAMVIATPQEIAEGNEEMLYDDMDSPAAAEMLGPIVHRRVATQLAPVLSRLV